MIIRNYKLELKGTKESVTFGPRSFGDSGRDILIIKNALGAIEDYSILVEGEDVPELQIHDPNGWFDCLEGKKVSDAQAATFDGTLRDYIVKYQLDNQFYILCYYFTKYAIPEAIASQNAIVTDGVFRSPIRDVLPESDVADWIASGDNKIYLSGGKSVEVEVGDIDEYRNNSFLSNQIELIVKMFDAEFGKIGEATLAIMHGWLPRTSLFNEGYYFDPRIFNYDYEKSRFSKSRAHDMVLSALFSSFISGDLSQKLQTEKRKGVIADVTRQEQGVEGLYAEYKEQVAIAEKVVLSSQITNPSAQLSIDARSFDFLPNHFGVVQYKTSARTPEFRSIIFESLEEVSSKFPKPDVLSSATKENYQESLERNLEPDPLIDPDPFIINEQKIGYFLKTEFTLEKLPPFPGSDNYEATIRQLEDLALSQVMSFYGKPEIFYLDTREAEYQLAFIGDMKPYFMAGNSEIKPKHNGDKLSDVYNGLEDQIWVLSTQTNYDLLQLGEDVQVYSSYERDAQGNLYRESFVKPLIEFVEFRTPSLRPGDTYRAKFFINKEKLDYITKGFREKLTVEQEEILQSLPVSRNARIRDLCDTEDPLGTSVEDNQRRYEEYRSVASKNKKEIARLLREKVLESYNNNDIRPASNIDLGVFGAIDVSNPLSAFGDLVGTSIANQQAEISLLEDPDSVVSDQLSISYADLERRCTVVSKDISSAYDFSLQDNITFQKPKNFNGAEKAMLLSNLPTEIRQLITKHGDGKFNFGDSPLGLGEGNYFDVNPLKNFTGIGVDQITFKFKNHPTKPGAIIESIKAGSANIFEGMYAGSSKKIFNEFPSLVDPIIVTYLAQIEEMSGGSNVDLIRPMFSPTPLSCRDLGVGKKGLGYLSRYTPGLKGKPSDDEPIKRWYQNEVVDPFNEWKDSSLSNLNNLFDPQFNTDALLAVLGKQCSITKLKNDVLNKIGISGFLCNFLKCLNLPAINISLPRLNLPPIPPKFSIFGWYVGLIQQILKKFFEILVRILCSLAQFILDFLSFPFCEEKLRDELYGEFAGNAPIVQQALVDGLLDLGISKDQMLPAKDFVAIAMSFLTGAEVCALLRGEPIDPTAMAMLQDLATKKGLEDLTSVAAIRDFFETLGVLIPEELCDDLEAATWVISTTDCEETTSAQEQYRRKMMAGEATQEDMDKALELLEKNLNDQLERLQALGEQGIEGLLPDIVNFGDPNALLNKLPDALEDQANHTMRQLFEPTKMGYLSSLSSFGPGLFLDTPRMPMPGDPEFDPEAFITVSTITHNLKMYAEMVATQNSELEGEYIAQLNMLHMIYEVDSTKGLVAYKHTENEFLPRQSYANFYKEEGRSNFKKLALSEIAQTPVEKIIYKPIGFSEDEYFRVNDRGRIESSTVTDEEGKIKFDLLQDPSRILSKDSNSNLEGFSFQANYVVEKQAEKEIRALQAGNLEQNQEIRPAVVDAGKQVVITAIKNRINKMQADLFANLNRISTPKIGTEYLGTIKRLFSQANETANENLKAQNQSANELIDVTNNDMSLSGIDQNVSSLTLNLQEGALRATVRYNEFPNTKSVQFDPYSVEIYNDNMFNVSGSAEAITIEECDTIPGPDSEQGSTEAENIYRSAINELGLDLANRRNNGAIYTRRELFARKIMSNLSAIGQKYKNSVTSAGNANRTMALINPHSASSAPLKKKLTGKAYSSAMEGIFEQIFFALESSRIYDEDDYYPGLARRVAGLMTIEGNGDNLCAKNRYNVSQLGLLSFEKMVTDELAKQLSNELSKPENAPQNLDYDSEGPFEKAIKNVCFLGFVRICLVELLLKGALAYSVWDLEGVIGEKIFESFMFEYIKKELNSRDTMKQNWEAMASNITGIANPETALKKLVRNQSMKMLDVSKKIYQNDPSDVADYHNWYSKYFIPQTHCSRNIAIRQGSTTRELSELDLDSGQVEGQLDIERTTADKIYWAHPLLSTDNIIIEDIERRTEGSALIDNISSLVGSNDPFFHIEHLVEVKGPLASIEGITIPGSVITNAILNVDVSRASGDTREAAAVRKVTTYISDNSLRSPRRMNVQDARSRTNLPLLNMGDYGFQAVPEQPEGAAGASLEQARQLNAEGEVDPSLYADTTEVFNVKDFKKTLNFKVTDGNMKKFLRHIKGHMYYPDPENGERPNPTSVIPDTTHPLLDDFPEEVRRLPTRFIKRTRRVIKFKVDFVSGIFDDFSVDGVELYKRRLYGRAYPSKYIGGPQSISAGAVSDFRKWKNQVESVQDTTEYFIQPDNAERLYKIFDAIQKNKEQKQEILIELSDENFNPNTGHEGSTLNQVINNIPDEASDYLDELSSFEFTGRTINSDIKRSHSGRYSESKKGFESPGLIKVDSKFVDKTAGITYGNSVDSLFFDANVTGGRLTTQVSENSNPITIFENKVGKFATKEDYDEAVRLASSLSEDQDPVAVLLKDVEAREEHWVETVYEFSGDGAVLGGVYGSYTIGETMDPAVFSFRPDGNTRAVWQRVIDAIDARRGNNSIKLFKESPAVSYGRTFWPKAGTIRGARGAQDQLGEALSSREVSIPYIARPMGIDKLTNRRMTSKVLARYTDTDRGDFLNIYSPCTRTISLDPARKPATSYNSITRKAYDDDDKDREIHLGTMPVFMETPRPDSTDTYFDVCKMLHARPLVSSDGLFVYPESRSRFLPPNIYRIPLRVLVTQVYVGGNVEKVYSKVVPPKYISNLSDRSMADAERGVYNDKVTENMSTLNQSIRNICNEYLGFVRDMGPEAGDFEPEFTRDFHFDFKGKINTFGDKYVENRKISAIDLDTRIQYCSIERIYSEAFEIETRQPSWNSKEELDRLFANDRGMLMFKSDPKVSADDLGAFSNHGERVSYLESLNYFYNIPENQSLVNNTFAGTFHRIIFSLNNIMQWFLRFRRHDSLWGLLTPQNSSDVTTKQLGYGGKQKFPLTRAGAKYSYRDNREFYRLNGVGANVPYRSPWQMGFFTEANQPNNGSGLRPTKESFWEGYKFGIDSNRESYSKYNTSTSFPEGALCLDHSFSQEGNEFIATKDDSSWAKIISDRMNNIVAKSKRERGVRDIAVDDPAKYLIPMYRQSGGDSFGNNLLDTIPLMDGFGDYYVNYNRLNGLPLLQSGSPLFVADGRISMDDVSKAIKITVNNIFQGASLESVGATFFAAAQNMFRVDESFFKSSAGDIVSKNFTFIRKVLLSLDPINEIQGAPLSVDGLGESNLTMQVLEGILVDEAQNGLKSDAIRSRINTAIENIRNLLNHLIKHCGTQLRFQTFLESDGKGSIFTSNNESLKQLTIMSRFLESINSVEANNAQKIALLVFLGQYDFAKTVIEFFSPGSGLSQIQKEAEKTWALCCLMWIHLWLAGSSDTYPNRVPTKQSKGNLTIRGDLTAYSQRLFYLPPEYGINVYFHRDSNSPYNVAKISHLRQPNTGKFIEGSLFGGLTEEAMQALERILAMIIHVNTSISRTLNKSTIQAHFAFKVSGQGLLSHDGPGRHTQRLSPWNSGAERLSINKLRKFLEGGEWNYDYTLGRALTNREIINSVYEIIKNFVKAGTAQETVNNEGWARYLFGGGARPIQPEGGVFTEDYFVDVIQSGIDAFAREENFRDHESNKWRPRYTVSKGNNHFDLHHGLKDKIEWIDERAPAAANLQRQGITTQQEGVIEIIQEMNDAISTRNLFKQSLYGRSKSGGRVVPPINMDLALPKNNLTLILGREIYRAMFPDERSYGTPALEAVRTSPKAARGYTYSKLKTIYNKKHIDNYRTFAFVMKFKRQVALEAYTNLGKTVNASIFDSAALINNQVMDGLFENSIIDQVCRLVINFNNVDSMELSDDLLNSQLFQLMSEEQRSILMGAALDMGERDLSNMVLSVPVAEYREPMSKFGMTGEEASDNFLVSCYSIDTLVEDFEKKTSWMAQELLAKDSSKLFMKYIFPTKRYQALATIFATTSLSGYTTMPELMRAPKSSLSFLMGISSMSSKERLEMFKNMSQAELFKSLSDNKSSEPRAMKCFDLPFNEDFLDNFLDLLLEQIKEFPAVLFRGLANVIDPAYKEMKMHWDDCDMRNLTYSGWKPFTADGPKKIQGGAHGADGEKKYASLLVSSVADLGWSIGKLFSLNPQVGARGLAHSVSHITNYIYKGPLSLLDGSFQFQFPCKDVDEGWDPGSQFNSGRYGHPFTPLTYIALAMPELRGDKRLRAMSGRCEDDSDQIITRNRLDSIDNCSDGEDAPFGEMPEPKDFEE